MKPLALPISMALAVAFAGAAPAATVGLDEPAAPAPGYPSFCAIPPTPTGVRTPAQFKAAVVDVRLDGRQLARQTGPDSWSLAGGEDFARAARAEAAAPPPIDETTDTEAFAAAARAAAKPPARH